MSNLHTVNSLVSWPILNSGAISDAKHEKLFHASGLPVVLIERNPTLVPLHAGEKWLNLLLRDVGDETFLFRTISSSLTIRGMYQTELQNIHMRSPLEMANAVVGISNRFSSGARITSRLNGDVFSVYRIPGTTPWTDTWPAIQVILGIIYTAVNVAFGASVQPIRLRLPLQKKPSQVPDLLSGIPLRLGEPAIGLDFDKASLNVLGLKKGSARHQTPETDYFPLTNEISPETVRACLSSYLLSYTTDMLSHRVATAFGVSSRQYRRLLKDMGTSHARLLDEVKYNLALDLLSDTSLSISEVAMELSYNHPGDFTRFMRRKTGMTPREWKRSRTMG